MFLARRAFLRGSGAALLTSTVPGLAMASALPPRPATRHLAFENIHTGERLAVDYCTNGKLDAGALAAINHVLRDYRNNEVHAIDTKLLDLLHDIHGKLETDTPFQVISGYRSPATNNMLHERSSGVAAKSLHMQGMAIDIRLADRALDKLHNAALNLGEGGVGIYPTSNFVHVDVGRVRRWSGV